MERLVNRLFQKPNSSLLLATLEDEEAAEEFLAEEDKKRSPGASSRPPLSSWSPEIEYLSIIGDRVGEMIATLIATSGNKPPLVKPLPRPLTAVDRARLRRSQERHESLVAEVIEAQERTGMLRRAERSQ